MKRQRSWCCLDLPPPTLLLSSIYPQSALAFLYALRFSCATDFSMLVQTDLYREINCLLLGIGLLWTKQPGLTAGWAAISHAVFCRWAVSTRELLCPFELFSYNALSQCYGLPNLSTSLTLTVCFWAPPWL